MQIVLMVLGGLAMFLYGVSQLSLVLKDYFSTTANTYIAKYTDNLFMAMLVGIVATVILNSSSGSIILTIVLINAGALKFRSAIGIILGANIGTTFSSKVIALGLGSYSIIPLAIGVLAYIFIRNPKWRRWGLVSLYFGMLFFGLYLMQEAVIPLKDSEFFKEMILKIDTPIKGVLVGGLMTLVIQSSGATVAMSIILGNENLISLATALAIMLGAELGTCSDTLLATIKGSREALKAGLFHLLFNLFCIVLGLVFFELFEELVIYLGTEGDIGDTIANGHILFNVLGVLAFLPFVGIFEKVLDRVLPSRI